MKALALASVLLVAACDRGSVVCVNEPPVPTRVEVCYYAYAGAQLVVRGGALVCECPGKPVEVRP
jgi:hypothetical protein